MPEEIDYAARVQRGIALMDEKWPDWATQIDLETLDIKSSTRCVTAQYDAAEQRRGGEAQPLGWYGDGMERLGILDNEEYAAHGFNADFVYDEEGENVPIPESTFDTLTALWRAEIERRRAQGQDAPAEPEAGA